MNQSAARLFIFNLTGSRLISPLAVFLSFFVCSASAIAQLKVPSFSEPVVDQAQLLSVGYQKKINQELRSLFDSGGPQIGILTVASLEGETIEGFSIRVVDQWKLGRKDQDDGLLLIIAASERRARIEVGRGLEGDLPDALAKRIINQALLPAFRSGQFELGVSQSLLKILELIAPNKIKLNLPARSDEEKSAVDPLKSKIAKGVFFLLMLLLFILNPRLFLLVLAGAMSGGRGGRGGGGRGSWSGGGGGFSGGGASGGW